MRSFLLYVLFLIVPQCISAQVEIQVRSVDNEGIPGARFEAHALPDSSGRIQVLSNHEGIIVLPSVSGLYAVKISSYGYESWVDTVELKGKLIFYMKNQQELDEMVVTAQQQATSVESAVQKITVITAEQIKNSGSNNLSDILSYQTGIRLAQDNVLGSSMDLGGISGQNVKILIDGVPVIGRLNGSIDLSQINLNNVERVEIVEGPLSVNYGTNALAGTVNIITKKKSDQGWTFDLAPYYESIGNYNLSASVAWNKKGHNVVLDGGRNFFDGWSANDPFLQFPKESWADTLRVKTWKPKEQYFGGLRYSFTNKRWQSSVYGKFFDESIENRGMPSAPYYESAFDDYYFTQRFDGGINTDFLFKRSKLTLLLAYNNYARIKNTYLKDLTTLEEVLSQSTGAQDTSRFNQYTGRLIFSGEVGKCLHYQLGTDLNQSGAWGRRIEDGHQSLGDYAAFLTVDWRILDSLMIKPGVRFAYNTAYTAPIVPSLNILYRVRQFSFRAAVARGFRSPDVKELYLDFVDVNHNITGNPELKAEDSWNYSLFVNWMKRSGNNSLIKLEYGAYFNAIHNLITLGILEDASYTYINIGEYSTIGQQLSLTYRAKRWTANVNATYIGRYNPDSESFDVDRYSFSPELGTNVRYFILQDRLQVNVFYKFNGQLQNFSLDEAGTVSTSRQAAYHILDLSFTADFLKKKNLSLTLGAKNLLNVQQVQVLGQAESGVHSSSSAFNAARGVSVFLGLRYQFQFKNKDNEK